MTAPDAEEYDLQLVDTNPDPILDLCTTRPICPTCSFHFKYFCYNCYSLNPCIEKLLPKVNLPLNLFVFKHFQELVGKSTVIHAKILAPDQTSIFSYPDQIPQSIDPSTCLLLYPSKDAKTVYELAEENSLSKFTTLIVIDGTWKQARGITSTESRPEHLSKHNVDTKLFLQKTQKVTLANNKATKFWRYQQLSASYLSTIEAIYFFFKEFLSVSPPPSSSPKTNIDDLLFFFKYFYNIVQKNYNENPNKIFTTRHSKNYIQK
ncbi:hypothetical protein BB560_006042 [Smittium megazygosporum]|uniref:tRNA-uridine aminocarboxypropyltransferase 1 n=1 Tax=Smittium megazygosporum TaxID=133381 RepID=A0A2T9YJZ6_9FUNG|nr:hypothetical protein BB560_006042 [Smittium megazygosporum]